MIEVPYSEIIRYLGYQKIQPNDEIHHMIQKCMDTLYKKSNLRKVYQLYPLSFEKDALVIATMHIHSKNLFYNLKRCEKVYLLAVTIGPAVDQLIRRSEIMNIVEAAIYQAAGAAYVEAWCDAVNQEIKEKAKAEGYICRPRFSPGYGDFSLTFQKDFSNLLDMPKNVGITLTDSLLMVPSKSVTAVIGLAKQKNTGTMQGCSTCNKNNCDFRK